MKITEQEINEERDWILSHLDESNIFDSLYIAAKEIVEMKKSHEEVRLIRDKMIERLRIKAGIKTQELKVIEKELMKRL